MNRATDVSVPNSDSKRSISGVRARIFKSAWMMLVWMNGNVFIRYAARRKPMISQRATEEQTFIRAATGATGATEQDLPENIDSWSGIKAPQPLMSHTDWNPTISAAMMRNTTTRVNRGSRRMNDRARAVLKDVIVGDIGLPGQSRSARRGEEVFPRCAEARILRRRLGAGALRALTVGLGPARSRRDRAE